MRGELLIVALMACASCRRDTKGGASTAPPVASASVASTREAGGAMVDAGIPISVTIALAASAADAGAPLEAPRKDPAGVVTQQYQKGCMGDDGAGGFILRTTCEPPKKVAAALERLARLVPTVSSGSDLAAGVTFLPTGERYLHRPHEPRVAASIGKWFWAAAALHKNEISTVEGAAVPAFAFSDNAKGLLLIEFAGGASAVNAFTEQQMGIPANELSLCRAMRPFVRNAKVCDRLAGKDNFFTPLGALMFLEGVWRGVPVAGEKRAALLRWSKLAPGSGFSIGHQLPKAAEAGMHHKRAELPTGCCEQDAEYNWTAEIAIIPTPRGPYAVALSLAHSDTYDHQVGAIEWVSCIVYHAVAEDVPDPFAASAGCRAPAPSKDPKGEGAKAKADPDSPYE